MSEEQYRDETRDEALAADSTESEPSAVTPESAASTVTPESAPSAESADEVVEESASEAEGEGVVELSELDQALLKVAELEEQVARRNADYYNLQQEYSNYVKRAKQEALQQNTLGQGKVIEALLGVLDNATLAREHGDLVGPAGKIVDELEHTLQVNFGLERFGSVGDAFDPAIHEALMHQQSDDVDAEQISHVIQPGYRQGERVLRAARVGVVSPQ